MKKTPEMEMSVVTNDSDTSADTVHLNYQGQKLSIQRYFSCENNVYVGHIKILAGDGKTELAHRSYPAIHGLEPLLIELTRSAAPAAPVCLYVSRSASGPGWIKELCFDRNNGEASAKSPSEDN
jgi:hypothetical protein